MAVHFQPPVFQKQLGNVQAVSCQNHHTRINFQYDLGFMKAANIGYAGNRRVSALVYGQRVHAARASVRGVGIRHDYAPFHGRVCDAHFQKEVLTECML